MPFELENSGGDVQAIRFFFLKHGLVFQSTVNTNRFKGKQLVRILFQTRTNIIEGYSFAAFQVDSGQDWFPKSKSTALIPLGDDRHGSSLPCGAAAGLAATSTKRGAGVDGYGGAEGHSLHDEGRDAGSTP